LDVSPEEITESLSASQPLISLTDASTSGEEGSGTELDIPVQSPDIEINDILALRQVMATLSEKDRKLLYLRYFENQTQCETAKALCMTQVQISRREKKLLQSMRMEMLK
jgi:RNA polymerase sporulation-specific sigma factor